MHLDKTYKNGRLYRRILHNVWINGKMRHIKIKNLGTITEEQAQIIEITLPKVGNDYKKA